MKVGFIFIIFTMFYSLQSFAVADCHQVGELRCDCVEGGYVYHIYVKSITQNPDFRSLCSSGRIMDSVRDNACKANSYSDVFKCKK